MATVVALDASPENVLRAMRGSIVGARKAYPEVLHIEIRDPAGNLWLLATQDAEWSPLDPAKLMGRVIEDATLDETGELCCRLSDDSFLAIKPGTGESSEDPPYWELIAPGGVVLEFGPGVRWQISAADTPASSRH